MKDYKFDLTTAAGLKAAAVQLDTVWDWAFPQWKLAKALIDWIGKESEVSPNNQSEAAERVIEAGRKNGAKKITFKVAKSVGAKLKGKAKELDADIEGSIGTDGSMELTVEYK